MEMPKLKKREPFSRVAFFGPMCSGKTFLSKALTTHGDYKRVALADKLKALAYDLYGITGKDGNGRKLLQEFADDVKKWDEDVFIKHFLYKVSSIESEKYPPKIVCDDVRFEKEGHLLKRNGFILIAVTCDEEERMARIARLYPNASAGVQHHRSEKEFNKIVPDFTVDSTNVESIIDILGIVTQYEENSVSWKAEFWTT